MRTTIPGVALVIRFAEVIPLVIEPVPLPMIDDLALSCAKDDAVHQPGLLTSVLVMVVDCVPLFPAPMGTPFPLHQPVVVLVIDDGDFPLREWYGLHACAEHKQPARLRSRPQAVWAMPDRPCSPGCAASPWRM